MVITDISEEVDDGCPTHSSLPVRNKTDQKNNNRTKCLGRESNLNLLRSNLQYYYCASNNQNFYKDFMTVSWGFTLEKMAKTLDQSDRSIHSVMFALEPVEV